ncbi:MAG TPA: TIGR00730 family Rossman fold protein [Flavipsychrobacter sp.]|nr:TIGR00730 family Rossman fold protein [Flavipsychrobacter sp.]
MEQPEHLSQNQSNKEFTPVGSKNEAVFLEGPHSRWKELTFLFDVMREFFYGLRKLHFVGPCVTVFGSARFTEANPYYKIAEQIGGKIASLGFTVMTGGGPGVMEAANKGAKEAGGHSVGCNIVLPKEQKPNKYLDKWIDIDYFFIRKTLLTKYSYAFVVMPGGYGTMDEFFEAITMIQTGKFQRFPVVLFGKEFHEELYQYMQRMAREKTISPEDLQLFLYTDSVDEAIAHIKKNAIEGFGLKKRTHIKL